MSTYRSGNDALLRPVRACFEALVERTLSPEVCALDHDEVEALVTEDGREVLRELVEAHMALRRMKEEGRSTPVGADGNWRGQRRERTRKLSTVFGSVTVRRLSFSARGAAGGLRPLDVELNLPDELYSLGMRRRAIDLVVTQSYESANEQLRKQTGTTIGKRQLEELAVRAAVDFDAFYDERQTALIDQAGSGTDILVLSTDGKGIVMRHDALREGTRKKAEEASGKLETRLSPGEKRNRKRMAEVAAVYDLKAQPRTASEVLPRQKDTQKKARPRANNKRVWASVEKPLKTVVEQCFEEALARDPSFQRTWVYLVDGNQDQLRAGRALAHSYGVELTIVVDFIHVLEYLWKAAWCFFDKGDKGVEAWVLKKARSILEGNASAVAGAIRRSATMRGLADKQRKNVDKCARFLLNQKAHLRYDDYLARGLPIATGVIEGACRHLINDRLGITGARWGLEGAEAMLRLRALKSSGDLDDYWAFHRRQERDRNHLRHYADSEFQDLRMAA